ncbi:MAG: hypothetical protein AAFY41_18320, partial [Bacteroidota bacterium]
SLFSGFRSYYSQTANGLIMKTSMFEYSKIILDKVSFNRKLFEREYEKFRTILSKNEHDKLKLWVERNHITFQ